MTAQIKHFLIYNGTSGARLGVWSGATEEHALDMMARDAGYPSWGMAYGVDPGDALRLLEVPVIYLDQHGPLFLDHTHVVDKWGARVDATFPETGTMVPAEVILAHWQDSHEPLVYRVPWSVVPGEPSSGCAHEESVMTADGHGAYCRFCGETLA